MNALQNGYTDLPPGKLAAVVTYLEMRGWDTPPGLSLPEAGASEFSLRRVEKPELAWYRSLFRTVGENWLWSSRLRKDDEALLAIIQHSAVDVHALSHEGRDMGILELDRRQFPEIELAFFGVAPELIGRGAGTFMMRRAIKIVRSWKPERFWLHTCTLDHPKAIGFYRKAGFTPYRRAVEILDDPRVAGHLPRTAAPHIPVI
ncbi:MAG: GNAT family N-acetyltransferase [Bryobacterales bacterium]|nr:GNAT family N-acetyltransferase [Bryobacterales bacterium]